MADGTFTKDDLVVARVVNEDDDFILLEIPKSDEHVFHLNSNIEQNQFYTMAFLKLVDGTVKLYKPWEI